MWTKTKKKYIVKKKIVVCGNDITEIEERYKKKYAYSYSFSIFFDWNSLVCHVLLWQKKVEWNCGNDIAEIGEKNQVQLTRCKLKYNILILKWCKQKQKQKYVEPK